MRLAVVLALTLVGCGALGLEEEVVNRITVRRYEDVNGNPTQDPNSLGFTYYASSRSSARHASKGWNCLLNEILLDDPDTDKLTRVIIHEFANVCIESDDYKDPMFGPGAYSWDADTLPPMAPISDEEAIWFSQHGPFKVSVRDDWLDLPTDEAMDRINASAQVEVFHR